MLGAAFTVTVKLALVAVAPELSVIVTIAELNVWTAVTVPVNRPLLLIPSVAGPLFST